MKEIMTSLIPDPEYFGESMGNDIWAYTEDQLVAYGKDCRNAALEEVATWLDFYDGEGMRRAEYVRSLK